jgi:hypothetical protein
VTPDHGACTEPELTGAVALCTPRGRLNPTAVGWSRHPVHDCTLAGSWGRRKRWDFWCVTGPGCVMNLTYADVDYLGMVDVWFRDLDAGREVARSVPVPLSRGVALPATVGGADIAWRGRGLEVSIGEEEGGTRLQVAFGAPLFVADVLVQRPADHESLSVVIPWSDRRFQCTTKDVARPAAGTIRWGDRTWTLAGAGDAWGCLDFGRGKWPYRTRWNWGAGAGTVERGGRREVVGVQLGGKWTDGTGMTENALVVDGRLSKISDELVWRYDRSDWLRPWRVTAPSGRVELTFTPVHDKVSRLQLGVAAQATDQCFGTWAGSIVPDDGTPIVVDDLFGWAEEASWRW